MMMMQVCHEHDQHLINNNLIMTMQTGTNHLFFHFNFFEILFYFSKFQEKWLTFCYFCTRNFTWCLPFLLTQLCLDLVCEFLVAFTVESGIRWLA